MAKFDVNQRQLVVAMDHGRAMGAVAGLEDPGPSASAHGRGLPDRLRARRRRGQDLCAGGVEAFRQVTASTPVPVLIAGGPKAGGPREALQVVRDSLDGGGRGVVFGRNIWQSPDPARMVAALRHLIHADGSVDEALQVLG